VLERQIAADLWETAARESAADADGFYSLGVYEDGTLVVARTPRGSEICPEVRSSTRYMRIWRSATHDDS
jgi:hypothetical protein